MRRKIKLAKLKVQAARRGLYVYRPRDCRFLEFRATSTCQYLLTFTTAGGRCRVRDLYGRRGKVRDAYMAVVLAARLLADPTTPVYMADRPAVSTESLFRRR
jgi:hypothetical protein